MNTPTHTNASPERIRDFLPLFDACKDESERHLLCEVIREGTAFSEFTMGFEPPYNVTDLIMVDVAKTMRRPH